MSRLPTALLALSACLLLPAGAVAQTGGAAPGGSGPPTTGTATDTGTAGGTSVGADPPRGDPPRTEAPARPSRSRRPVLVSFDVRGSRFYAYGSPPRVTFRIDGRTRTVRVRVDVYSGGRRVRMIDLGDRATRQSHTVALRGAMPEGAVQLRIAGRDPRGNSVRRGPSAASSRAIEVRGHRFPIAGIFSYGGEGSRFGAGRGNRSHQGQDLSAAEGTPLVAPRGGTIRIVAYQAGGAGNYIVLEGAGESRSYVFMHLQTGSTRVRVGQRVRTGTRLASVGNTGSSSGPHLHFEIWTDGPWQGGGRPIDPLPELRRWDSWS